MLSTNTELLENLNPFKNNQWQHLKAIKPKWAYAINLDKLSNKTINPSSSEYKIFLVETQELVQKSDFLKVTVSTLFDRPEISIKRISEILARWSQNLFIDPPTIYPSPFDKTRMTYEDGRHRTIVAYHLREITIPVAIDNTQFHKVRSILKSLQLEHLEN